MEYPVRKLGVEEFPRGLHEIPDPPSQLYVRGHAIPSHLKLLAVVGSRNYTNYGKQVVEYLVEGLRGHPIGIVSGLALGIDALAHEAALRAGLYTVAVPGSGIADEVLYPARNRMLAHRILDADGTLLSEFDPHFEATPWSFPQRNRLMAGMSHATLVIEASEKSGTLITARLTVDYNRELLVVPGNIFSENSKGGHQFLKLGATPITSHQDILDMFGMDGAEAILPQVTLSDTEARILEALSSPCDRDTLIRTLNLGTQEANVLFMSMELNGHIKESNGVFYKA